MRSSTRGRKCSSRCRPIPLYTAVLAKIGAVPRYYRTDPRRDWLPDLDSLGSLVSDRTRVLVVIDPNNPTGRRVSGVCPPVAHRIRRAARPDDPRRRGVRRPRIRRSGSSARHAGAGRADHFAVEPVEGLSGPGLARRVACRQRNAAPGRCARRDEEAGRRPAVQPRADAVRHRRGTDGRPIASAGVPQGAGRAREAHHARC